MAMAQAGRFLREPLFAFLVAGAAIFVLYDRMAGRGAGPVEVSATTRAALVADFEALTGRKAGPDDVDRLVRAQVADELLFRAALDEGRHLSDGIVRARLVEDMRLRIAGLVPDPSEEELVDYYAEHLERYRSEPAASFEHVFLREAPTDATAALAGLQRGARLAGDPFEHGRDFARYGESMLRGLFGQEFVAALWAAPLGQWSGPLRSTQGWHFLRVSERLPAQRLGFAEVRRQVESDVMAAAIDDAVARRLVELERRYGVRIAP
jgi:peptidyl-prolyl cis-trans isomerase C